MQSIANQLCDKVHQKVGLEPEPSQSFAACPYMFETYHWNLIHNMPRVLVLFLKK